MAGSGLNERKDYHLRQWQEPYRSTVHFCEFARHHFDRSRIVFDVACGAGGATHYLAECFPEVHFVGIDLDRELIKLAKPLPNLEFVVGDLYDLEETDHIDGVVMQQSLHTLLDPIFALKKILKSLKPKWFAASTLIYEGRIDCRIEVSEPTIGRFQNYNIIGLPLLSEAIAETYELADYQPFEIDKDLPKPKNPNIMGTYTLKTKNSRLQCSGPLILPWGFVMFERKHDHAD